jgi:hypothetical protein
MSNDECLMSHDDSVTAIGEFGAARRRLMIAERHHVVFGPKRSPTPATPVIVRIFDISH